MAHGAGTEAGRRERLSLLQQAVELDPTFALAYARMANAFSFVAFQDPAYAQRGIEMANRAIELQPDLSFGHSALGTNYLFAGRLLDAKVSYLRANELNPNDRYALQDHSICRNPLLRNRIFGEILPISIDPCS